MSDRKISLGEAIQLLGVWRDGTRVAEKGSPKEFFRSRAQIFQDIWVLYETGAKKDGYFIEAGGGDGINLSNSHFLEKEFGWTGVVAEPAKSYYPGITDIRDCKIDRRCLWSVSGQHLSFNETPFRELSTLERFSSGDMHAADRISGIKYDVETISLMDLLSEYGAPNYIDYLSLDTEGSEFDILSTFDFDKYNIHCITVEHNYTSRRTNIFELLTKHGYIRKFENISRFDDWYVKPGLSVSPATE